MYRYQPWLSMSFSLLTVQFRCKCIRDTHTNIHWHAHALCVCVCTYTDTYACVFAIMYTYVHRCIVRVYIYVCMHMHILLHIYTHTYHSRVCIYTTYNFSVGPINDSDWIQWIDQDVVKMSPTLVGLDPAHPPWAELAHHRHPPHQRLGYPTPLRSAHFAALYTWVGHTT